MAAAAAGEEPRVTRSAEGHERLFKRLRWWQYWPWVGAGMLLGALVARRWSSGAGPRVLSLAAAAGAVGAVAARRRLGKVRQKDTVALVTSVFDEETAAMFQRLPQSMDLVAESLGLDALSVSEKLAFLPALVSFSNSGERQPYCEARADEAPQLRAVPPEALIFAEAAYEEAKLVRRACGTQQHTVIYIEESARPGAPSHFLSYRKEDRTAVLAIRGTKTPADLLTDATADVKEHRVRNTGLAFSAHEGIFTAAHFVLGRAAPILRDFLAPQSYRLLITGHSLGAGTAAVLALMLPGLMQEWAMALPARCVCFAPPPCLDARAAAACPEADGEPPLLSFVCNDDMIPRMSMRNLGGLAMLARGTDVREVIHAPRPGGRKGSSPTADDTLLVPGEVVALRRRAFAKAEEPSSPAVRPLAAWSAGICTGHLDELQVLELAPRSLADHMAPTYREAIAAAAAGAPEVEGAGLPLPPATAESEAFADWLGRIRGGAPPEGDAG